MCGIAGIYSLNARPPQREQVTAMTDRLSHRGPDGHGVFLEGAVALGHRRLSIIDVESGSQPMESATGRSVISFNGEIYNFQELRKDLAAGGARFRTKSDTEVILALYEKHGSAFLQYLSGMFAFALWDRASQSLLVVRDRIGIKPLYYVEHKGRLVFASEIKALHALCPELDELDPASVNSYFIRQYIGGPGTIFKKIKKLPPATFLEVREGRVTERKYWQPQPVVQNDITMASAVRELDGMMHGTVSRHLISDVPVGLFLSGGLDSSSLLSYISREGAERIHTFSVGFGAGSALNETDTARELASQFGTHHHEIHVTSDEVLNTLPHVISNLDQPLADYAILPTFVMSRFAATHVKVVLSGEGADELFAGYNRYHLYALLDQLPSALSHFRYARALLPGACLFKEAERRRLLPEAFIADSDLAAEQQMLADKAFFDPAGHLNSMLYTDLRNWLVDDLLIKVDKMGMLASLEARVPYLDHKLVEYVLALRGMLKAGLRQKKRLLKQVAALHLPAELLARPKHGFTVPVGQWFRGPLRKTISESMMDRLAPDEWLSRDVVNTLYQQHLKGRDNGLKLWSILIFNLWLTEIRNRSGVSAGRVTQLD